MHFCLIAGMLHKGKVQYNQSHSDFRKKGRVQSVAVSWVNNSYVTMFVGYKGSLTGEQRHPY